MMKFQLLQRAAREVSESRRRSNLADPNGRGEHQAVRQANTMLVDERPMSANTSMQSIYNQAVK